MQCYFFKRKKCCLVSEISFFLNFDSTDLNRHYTIYGTSKTNKLNHLKNTETKVWPWTKTSGINVASRTKWSVADLRLQRPFCISESIWFLTYQPSLKQALRNIINSTFIVLQLVKAIVCFFRISMIFSWFGCWLNNRNWERFDK